MTPLDQARLDGFFDEMEKIAEKEKIAIDPITTLVAGAGMHAGLNAGMKALRHTNLGRGLEASQVATGLQHAFTGRQIRPGFQVAARYGIGPESLVNYDMGRALGGQLSEMSRGRQFRFLKKLRKNIAGAGLTSSAPVLGALPKDPALAKEIQAIRSMGGNAASAARKAEDVPIWGPLSAGVDKYLSQGAHPAPESALGRLTRRITTSPASDPGTVGKAVAGVLGAGAVVAEPHLALHGAMTAGRNLLSKSRTGQRFMRNEAVLGALEGSLGERLSPGISALSDLALSPAALDSRKAMGALGAKVREIGQNPSALRGRSHALKSLMGQATELPVLREPLQQIGQRLPLDVQQSLGVMPSALSQVRSPVAQRLMGAVAPQAQPVVNAVTQNLQAANPVARALVSRAG